MTRERKGVARRRVLEGAAALAAASVVPARLMAADEPIRLGAVVPLTGGGGAYGPSMLKAMQGVVDRVNAAGGVRGRKVELIGQDDETNPDSGVKAARKLIDVDKVAAIMGTWASAVTTAVAPLCWESKVFLTTVSGSDTITKLPHQGYLVRTQPNTDLQIAAMAQFMLGLGMKRVAILGVQAPFAVPTREKLGELLKKGGSELAAAVIYDNGKTSYRSEVDQALKAKPDMIFLNGYTPDVTVVMKDLYKAGYSGARIAQAYAVNQKFLDSMPSEVTDGCYTFAPSPDVGSAAYQRLAKFLGNSDLDPYSCQTNDHASMVVLAIAKAGEASGTAIRDNIRKVTQPGGTVVDDAVEGLKLLAQGKDVKYTGASGPCTFNEIGDILSSKFRYEQAEKGKFKLLKIA